MPEKRGHGILGAATLLDLRPASRRRRDRDERVPEDEEPRLPDLPKFFPTRLEAFAGCLGAQVGAKFGQGFYVQDVLKIEDPLPLFT